MRAAFYEGFALNYYNNQTSHAVVYAMQAYEIAKQTNNFYWLAKSAEMLEDIMGASKQITPRTPIILLQKMK